MRSKGYGVKKTKMKIYCDKKDIKGDKLIALDDMILTKDFCTTAGSKMLEGYKSLFDAQVVSTLKEKGYDILGKTCVGEFNIDLVGETNYVGGETHATAKAVKSGEVLGAICLEVNGSVVRQTAQNGLCMIKPTYGVVSRYGTIPVVCSGETVSVMASSVESAKSILDDISGHDDKDGTSLSSELCSLTKNGAPTEEIKKVAVLKSLIENLDEKASENFNSVIEKLKNSGVEVTYIEDEIIKLSNIAWNALMSAELCNNVSRYDGVKYGYRSKTFTNVYDIYKNSRTEAFGEFLKTVILFGSETLSTENYSKVYDKCLRMRRVIVEEFGKIFANFSAVLMPACSKMEYSDKDFENKYLSLEENVYTAPQMITGLPVVSVNGVQLVGKAFSENALCDLAKKI